MVTKEQVRQFLRDFKDKKKIWGILFRDDRGKNAQSLADLEIRPNDREKVIDSIEVEDYSEGPIEEKLNKGSEMWVFGKKFKTKELYIKINLGWKNTQVICISFHVAEYSINYPLKH